MVHQHAKECQTFRAWCSWQRLCVIQINTVKAVLTTLHVRTIWNCQIVESSTPSTYTLSWFYFRSLDYGAKVTDALCQRSLSLLMLAFFWSLVREFERRNVGIKHLVWTSWEKTNKQTKTIEADLWHRLLPTLRLLCKISMGKLYTDLTILLHM